MKVRYLFLAGVAFGVLSIVSLRYNSTRAFSLKNQVLELDSQAKDTKAELEKLKRFVFAHMNTSISVELVSSYERALDQAKASQQSDVYARAQASCDQRGVSSVAQASCVQRFLAKNLSQDQEPEIDKTRFIYAFAAPALSFDLAGFSLVIAIALTVTSLVMYSLRLFRSRPEPTL